MERYYFRGGYLMEVARFDCAQFKNGDMMNGDRGSER